MSISNNTRKREDEEESELPPPPDGGWGWVVVFASFMIHIVTDGVTYSFGVFYDEFMHYFDEGSGATSWILSILVGITLCSGPISSSFVNRWGCRPVTIAGAILASICLIISCWARNVTTLYFTVGIGTGLGFGLIYLPAIVSVTTYFEKKRSLATGIAVCGSGLGTFIFAPFINLLLNEYGWRGAMLIVAGLVLECIIFGALFRPLEFETEAPSLKEKEEIEDSAIALKSSGAKMDIHISDHNLPAFLINSENEEKMERPRSMGHFSIPKPLKSATLEKNGNLPSEKFKSNEIARLAFSHPALCSAQSEGGRPLQQFGSQHLKRPRPLCRPDVFYQGSLMNIPYYRSRSDLKSAEEADLMGRRLSTHSKRRHSDVQEYETTVCGIVPCSQETKDTLREMLDFSLFNDPIFVIFTLSNFFTSIGFYIPYLYIVSQAKAQGITAEKATMLLSVIGVANTIGRIILGYVSDNPKINRLLVYNLCLTICGLATTFSALCVDFYSLAVYCTVFGFTIGAYVGLTSVILVDLLGLDKLTNAFGLLLLFQGIASLVGPPIAGVLHDITGSYNPGFYVAGITIAVSGVMLFAIPPVQRWLERKKSRSSPPNHI